MEPSKRIPADKLIDEIKTTDHDVNELLELTKKYLKETDAGEKKIIEVNMTVLAEKIAQKANRQLEEDTAPIFIEKEAAKQIVEKIKDEEKEKLHEALNRNRVQNETWEKFEVFWQTVPLEDREEFWPIILKELYPYREIGLKSEVKRPEVVLVKNIKGESIVTYVDKNAETDINLVQSRGTFVVTKGLRGILKAKLNLAIRTKPYLSFLHFLITPNRWRILKHNIENKRRFARMKMDKKIGLFRQRYELWKLIRANKKEERLNEKSFGKMPEPVIKYTDSK